MCSRSAPWSDGSVRFEFFYILVVWTGMRQGELSALKWEDVGLERGLLRVRRTLTHVGKAFVTGELKTKKSRRTIKLTKQQLPLCRPPLPPARGDGTDRFSLPTGRPRIRHGERHLHQPLQPQKPLLQATLKAGEAAAYTFSRPPIHLRHLAPLPQSLCQNRL